MLLKRQYDPDLKAAYVEAREKFLDEHPGLERAKALQAFELTVTPPPITHVKVLNHGKHQKFSSKMMERGLEEGWLTNDGKHLTINTGPDDPDVRYKIIAPPGIYCCHCGEPCPDEPNERRHGKAARAHVAEQHAGEDSPSERNPSGYANNHFFLCELEE